MDLKAHIQAARRAPVPGVSRQTFEIDGGGIPDGRRPSIGLPESPALAVLASVVAMTLLWLAV